MARDLRHAARPHPSARQAGRGPGATRTSAPARRAAPHRPRVGNAPAAALRRGAPSAPFPRRSTSVTAWWGTFDLAVSLFSGQAADPPSNDFIMRNSATAQQIEVGWWPGDARYPRPAFFAFAFPSPDGFDQAILTPAAARWDSKLGEYL